MAGNTKKVESTKLIKLIPVNKLKETSLKAVICSRHLINASFILPPNEYTLLNFIIFMSKNNVIRYSITFLKQYDAATSRMIELHGPCRVNYSTSRDIARESFIGLIEKGYLIRIKKNDFMINPMLVYPKNASVVKIQERYQEILEGDNMEEELTKWCNSLIK